ncbi:hypothetical protein BDW62DRAFT_207501 [Aspergillus aurantiobrunneus]
MHETPVRVVGAGPAGMLAALQLTKNGTPSILVERNLETTKWPKMDITNCRSVEILRRLGVADGLRQVGVDPHWSFDVLFCTGLGEGEVLTKWNLPSPNDWEKRIKDNHDGSMPRVPYQRCFHAVFEAWLKPKLQETSLDNSRLVRHTVISKYVIACDGAGSRVRRSLGITLRGGPVPSAMWLIHFKLRDLERLRIQGQFWHIFFTAGQVLIAQDEKGTWTVHTPIATDANGNNLDVGRLDPHQAVYEALGGEKSPFIFEIDEILVTNSYSSKGGRVFLAGDSAHQSIPTEGYGMNTAVGDSFDITWKIGAVLGGYAGNTLLASYEQEGLPVGARNIERSGVHYSVHATYVQWCRELQPGIITSDAPEGQELRKRLVDDVQLRDGENQEQGIELGYRHNDSSVIARRDDDNEFIPSIWPGSRAPHAFLHEGETSIFDLFGTGNEFTLVDFTPNARFIEVFDLDLRRRRVPCKMVHIPMERYARGVWERDAVLVRPDDHVAWCSALSGTNEVDVEKVLDTVLGAVGSYGPRTPSLGDREKHFTLTIGDIFIDSIEGRGKFQQ